MPFNEGGGKREVGSPGVLVYVVLPASPAALLINSSEEPRAQNRSVYRVLPLPSRDWVAAKRSGGAASVLPKRSCTLGLSVLSHACMGEVLGVQRHRVGPGSGGTSDAVR